LYPSLTNQGLYVFVIVVCVRLPLNYIKLIVAYLYSTEYLFLVLFAFLKRTIEMLCFATLIPICEFLLGRWMFYLQVCSFPLDMDVTEYPIERRCALCTE
jgi:hypothetical protein